MARPRHGSRPYRASSPRHATSYDDRNRFDSDSWRPGDRRPAPRHSRDDYRSTDSYRPQPPQGDFTFRFDKPAGISDYPSNNNYPPRRGGRRDGRGRGRGGRRWQPPPHPSERALISGATANLPEERLADEGGAKYRDVEELSDDDEADMDISSRSSASDTEGPSKKRARTTDNADSGDAAPKWSNPDPYTALPCPDETQRKKKDVVKLIRKARVEEAEAKPAATTEAEDFISFDLSDEEEDEEDVEIIPPPPSDPPPPQPPPPDAPTGPRAAAIDLTADRLPPPPDRSGPLGSRKRTANDEIKPPDYGQLKKVSMKPSKGSLVPAWLPKANEDPCPWATVNHSATTDMAFR